MRTLTRLLGIAAIAASPFALGCESVETSDEENVVDVDHTDVERQFIGNCWLYAQASWVESMHKTATGESLDISQSYWTYWHWWDEIIFQGGDEISTGGNESIADKIIEWRGIVREADFIPEDAIGEGSQRQASALAKMNQELKSGRLSTPSARKNRKLVRQVLDEAWQLSPTVVAWMTKSFGPTGTRTFLTSATFKGSPIIRAKDLQVRYAERETDPNVATLKDTNLIGAMDDWETDFYPFDSASRRNFQIRVQRSLHDRNPVVMTWDVDFNAMENGENEKKGSFNLETLNDAGGPGSQGGHMVVMEDYQINTQEFGLLAAGVTLDPSKPEDQKKLDAALLPSSEVVFFRVKNSWGAFRDDRAAAQGFPGYHDLYMDYLNGPIAFCPSVEGVKTKENCFGQSRPFRNVRLPSSY